MKCNLLKINSLLLVCTYLFSVIASAQKIDSVKQLIRTMGYDFPHLSPIPEYVNGIKTTVINLNGTWKFTPDRRQNSLFQNIEVPGEWVMQGFAVTPGSYATYLRDIDIPSDWKDKQIKLRCDAVYSECEIFVNGEKAGGHLGGFTAFETDITEFVQYGKTNRLSINVRSESIADSLSSASQYAVHPLGGISRKIFLMALPEVNCSMFHISTVFDKEYNNASLNVEVELVNEILRVKKTGLRFELSRYNDKEIILRKDVQVLEDLNPGVSELLKYSFKIESPSKWDPEHPNLYTLKLSVISGGKIEEAVIRNFGFKQTEVRGNQVYVNNKPIKLRGVCRHEVMPLRGRSVSAGQWEEDVKIFREANINYIRTSHYPPAPELVEACDRLGMFIEVEGPYCWAERTKVPEKLRYPALIQPGLEMVNTFRSNPSVLMWSIGNESEYYKEYFSQIAALIKIADTTRPRNFSQYEPGGDNFELEIGNHHYPGPTGPQKYAESKRPIIFDEFSHLNAYNRFELVTDPGIRDAWGICFERMWENMYYSKGVLGGSIWAAIDDTFFLSDSLAVGYGTWGPIDGWRRPKPEYWHVKKVYSPVKIKQVSNRDSETGELKLEIENRLLFSDLEECKFTWKAGTQSGGFSAKAGTGERTSVYLQVHQYSKVYVEVCDPRGIVIDQYEFTAIPEIANLIKSANYKTVLTETNSEIHLSSGNISIIIDRANNCLKKIISDGKTMIVGDAALMILPLNGKGNGIQMNGDSSKYDPFTDVCKDRVLQKMELISERDGYSVRFNDINNDAKGYTQYLLSNGELKISYRYEISRNINPRQVGLVFNLPSLFQQLEWVRNGQWNFYPEDHIGRLFGKAIARNNNPVSGFAGPSAKPLNAWADDQNELGTNDFRSTKINITKASLSDGSAKVTVVSDGSLSVRCWLNKTNMNMLVASYCNMGSERFQRIHTEFLDRPLKPGDYISGTIELLFNK